MKLKTYKLERDNRKMIIQQIEWLKNETGEKVYIPISNEDLQNKTREEIVQIISAIIDKTLNK